MWYISTAIGLDFDQRCFTLSRVHTGIMTSCKQVNHFGM